MAPGLIFAEDDDVAPDVVWISKERLAVALKNDGWLHSAPELVIEVLSPGSANENRDYEVKRKLYSRQGVKEYWIVSWQKRQIDVYRRDDTTQELSSGITLYEGDTLTSPLLHGFSCGVREVFEEVESI